VGMPHVLWQLSGMNVLNTATFDSHDKAVAAAIAMKGLTQIEPAAGGKWLVKTVGPNPDAPGKLTPVEYRAFVADLVNFLDYMAEPNKNKRISIGIVVLLFLGVLFTLVYALKRSYWKDVH
jgi:ubiquinol-cytochrome c reductase cytochrome c1 subunit